MGKVFFPAGFREFKSISALECPFVGEVNFHSTGDQGCRAAQSRTSFRCLQVTLPGSCPHLGSEVQKSSLLSGYMSVIWATLGLFDL